MLEDRNTRREQMEANSLTHNKATITPAHVYGTYIGSVMTFQTASPDWQSSVVFLLLVSQQKTPYEVFTQYTFFFFYTVEYQD